MAGGEYLPRRSFLALPRHRPFLKKTKSTVQIIEYLMDHPLGQVYANELIKALDMDCRIVVSILHRLEDLELLESRISPNGYGSSAKQRRIYWLNPHDGRERAETWIRRGGHI